jgi:hypothetical protein
MLRFARGSAASISASQPRYAAVTGVLAIAEWPVPSNRLLAARCSTLSDLLKDHTPAHARTLFRGRVPAGGDLQRLRARHPGPRVC